VLENAKMKVDKMKDTSMAVEAVTEMALNSRQWSAAGAQSDGRARRVTGARHGGRRCGVPAREDGGRHCGDGGAETEGGRAAAQRGSARRARERKWAEAD
jgi:hypothetical protein